MLVNPHIDVYPIENDLETLHLPVTGLKQRIVQLEGKGATHQLLEIEETTTLGKIYGYVTRLSLPKKGESTNFFS